MCLGRGSASAAGSPTTSRTAGLPATPPPIGLAPTLRPRAPVSMRALRDRPHSAPLLVTLGKALSAGAAERA
eukprot:11974572-Alexandrium_andersonii.AAC.1